MAISLNRTYDTVNNNIFTNFHRFHLTAPSRVPLVVGRHVGGYTAGDTRILVAMVPCTVGGPLPTRIVTRI